MSTSTTGLTLRLDRLRGENFRRLASVDVAFPDGLIGIVGPNGSGKSSLAEMILFAFAGVDALRTAKDDVVGAADADLSVTLGFSVGDHAYEVTRSIRKRDGAAAAALSLDGSVIARGVEAVTAETARLVGSLRELSLGRFVAQKQLNALSSYQSAERKRLILRLLGISEVEEAIKRLRGSGTELDRTMAARRSILPDGEALRAAVAAVEAEIALATSTIAGSEREAARLSAAAAAAEAEAVTAESAVALLAAVRATAEMAAERAAIAAEQQRAALAAAAESVAAAAELARIDERLAGIERERAELESADAVARARGRREELDRSLAHLRAAALEDRRSIERLSTEATTAERLAVQITAAEGAAAEAAAAVEASESARGELRARLAAAREQSAAAEHRLAELASGAGSCPTCGEKINNPATARGRLEEERRRAAAAESAIMADGLAAKQAGESAAAARERAAAELGALRARRAPLEGSATALRAATAAADERERQIAATDAEYGEISRLPYDEARHAELQARAAAATELLIAAAAVRAAAGARAAAEERAATATAKSAEAQAAAANAAAAAVGGEREIEAAAAARRTAETATANAAAAALELERRRGDLRLASERRDRAAADLSAHAALAAELERMADERAAVEHTREAMERFKTGLIGRIRPALERRASSLLAELTDGRYTTMRLDEDYEISFGVAGEVASIKRASGGEEDLLNLCLRLAISELIGEATGIGRSFLFLDEILAYQDADRIERIAEALRRLTGRFGQVLEISHLTSAQDRHETVIAVRYDPATATSSARFPEAPAALVVPAAVAAAPVTAANKKSRAAKKAA